MFKKLLIIGLSILMFSCNLDTSEKTLVGSWRFDYSSEVWEELTFRDDKTFFISGSNYELGAYAFSGNYSNSETDFTLYIADYYMSFDYGFSGSNLVVSYPEGDQYYSRQ